MSDSEFVYRQPRRSCGVDCNLVLTPGGRCAREYTRASSRQRSARQQTCEVKADVECQIRIWWTESLRVSLLDNNTMAMSRYSNLKSICFDDETKKKTDGDDARRRRNGRRKRRDAGDRDRQPND